jgi:hypothetical protein
MESDSASDASDASDAGLLCNLERALAEREGWS